MLKKLDSLSTVAKASLVYVFANLMIKGIGFFTLPIFTRLLSVEEMGLTTTFYSWQSIIAVVASLSLSSGSFAKAMLDFPNRRDGYEKSILLLSTLSSLTLFALYLINRAFWNAQLELSTELIFLMMAGFIFLPATEFWLARQRFEYKYKQVAIVSFGVAITSTLASVGSVLYFKGSYNAGSIRLFGSLSTSIFVAMFFYANIIKNGNFNLRQIKKDWIYALKINIPLVFHSLSKLILDVSDRIMISKMVNTFAVGIYGVLYNLSTLSLIVWNAINNALVPTLFELLSKGVDGEQSIKNTIHRIVILFAVIAILLTLLAPEIVQILATEEYHEAVYIMPPIAAGIFFTALYNLFGDILIYHKATKFVMISTMLAAFINVILNFIFIKKYGYIAAAYTTLVCYILLSLFQFFSMLKIHGHDPYNSKILWIVGTIVVVANLLILEIYDYIFARYAIVCGIIVVLVLLRKKIQLTLSKFAKNKT